MTNATHGHLAPSIAKALLRFSEERTGNDVAIGELRCILDEPHHQAIIAGALANHDGLGVQLLAPGGAGFLAVRLYYDDFVEPLIVRKGTSPRPGAPATSCCMTMVPCGGGLKCLTAEDPCPSKDELAVLPFRASESPGLRRLFDPERQLAAALLDLAFNTAAETEPKPEAITRATEQLRGAHAHRELLLALQPDGAGLWIDWFLKLSNGAVIALQVAHGDRRHPLLIEVDADEFPAAGGVIRFDFVVATSGDAVMAPRVYGHDPHRPTGA
jgi:hypothetical protein